MYTIVQKIGPCKFSELPQPYRNQFESGEFRAGTNPQATFFPYKPSFMAMLMAILLSAMYIVPVLLLIYAGLYSVFKDSTLISRILTDMTAGVLQFMVIVAIFGTIVWSTYFMLKMSRRAFAGAAAWSKVKRAAPPGKHHYGLLLDEQSLVLRHGEHLQIIPVPFCPKRR